MAFHNTSSNNYNLMSHTCQLRLNYSDSSDIIAGILDNDYHYVKKVTPWTLAGLEAISLHTLSPITFPLGHTQAAPTTTMTDGQSASMLDDIINRPWVLFQYKGLLSWYRIFIIKVKRKSRDSTEHEWDFVSHVMNEPNSNSISPLIIL